MAPPAATAAGRTIPRPAAPRRPRRVSGPTRTRGTAPAPDPLVLRALHRVIALADSRLLRRLIHGRLWIPLVGAALMGIVFMQVTMLKFNAGIGRDVQTASTLERQNASMRAQISRMESGEKIDAVAHSLGMVVPAEGGERYVTAGLPGTAKRAAERMTAPDAEAVARTQAVAATQAANANAAVTDASNAVASTSAQQQQQLATAQTTAQQSATQQTTTQQSATQQTTAQQSATQQSVTTQQGATATSTAQGAASSQTQSSASGQADTAASGGVVGPATSEQG